mgnify:CR=1 FL=1
MGIYWDKEGRYEDAAQELFKLIPQSGSVDHPRKNKALEKFRKACGCYYDLYNNGLCNRMSEFRTVFGFAASPFKQPWRGYGRFDRPLYLKTEEAMDKIVLNAAREQGVIKEYQGVSNAEKLLLLHKQMLSTIL